MNSEVPVSALHPLACPSPLALSVASCLLLGKPMRLLHWVDGGVGFCPMVDLCLSRVSSPAVSANGTKVWSFDVGPTFPVVPEIWPPTHCGCLLTLRCEHTEGFTTGLRVVQHVVLVHFPCSCGSCQIVFANTLITKEASTRVQPLALPHHLDSDSMFRFTRSAIRLWTLAPV